jgi:hypothetical protein
MASDPNRMPTKTMKTSKRAKRQADAGATPMARATAIISEPLTRPRKDAQRMSPATASSAETGVAMSES